MRVIELSAGGLDDAEAMRQAATTELTDEGRIARRAEILAEALGLPEEIAEWRAMLPGLGAFAAYLIAMAAWQILANLTGHDRAINALGALGVVLTLPTLTLILWVFTVFWSGPGVSGGVMRWMVAITAWAKGRKHANSRQVVRGALDALNRAQLVPWLFGFLNHLIWIGAFTFLLLGLLLTFSFRSYTLTWETTILSPTFFADLITATGWLPSLVGLPVPDAAAVLASASITVDQRPWAYWLLGCILLYGLAPRVLAACLCVVVLHIRRPRLHAIDRSDSYFRELLDQFKQWDDAVATSPTKSVDTPVRDPMERTKLLAMVGFELPDEVTWPPGDLAAPDGWVVRIAGTADERRDTLDRIARTRPGRVLIACHAPSTPDRGTLRFIQSATRGAHASLWLTGGPEGLPRWRSWLAANDLGAIEVLGEPAQAAQWIHEAAHV